MFIRYVEVNCFYILKIINILLKKNNAEKINFIVLRLI